jgi:protocatechuate 3,4-dioxygenase beta subunit
MGRWRLLLLGAAVAAIAALAWRAATDVGADRDDDAAARADAPAALEGPGPELRALASAEAARRRRLPGMEVARHGFGRVIGRVARFVAGQGETPLADVVLELAASVDGDDLHADGASGEDGAFTIAPVPAATGYVLRARHPSYRDLVVGGLVVGDGRVTDVGALVFGAPTTLAGAVVDGTGRPLSGALVSVEADRVHGGRIDLFRALRDLAEGAGPLAQGRTAGDGTFALQGLPPGRYMVRVALGGYAGAFVSGVVVTADGDAAGVRVVLDPGAGFEGRVTDDAGRPVEGAAVVALPFRAAGLQAYERHEARSGPDGRYRLDTLADETTYFVEAVAAAHAPFGRILTTKKVRPLDFTLPGAGRVEGRITDVATGAPVEGAEVVLVTGLVGAGAAPASVVADALGRFAFEHALPGPVVLLDARAPGYARGLVGYDAKAPRVVVAGQTLVLDLALPPGGVVRGTVRGEDGRPVAFASVSAWIPRSPIDGEVAVLTDPSGAYRLSGLRQETWRLTVTAPGWAPPVDDATTTVAVRDGQPDVIRDVVLRPGGVVAGAVTQRDGAGVGGVRVTVRPRDARALDGLVRELVAVTDRLGAYRVTGVPSDVDLVVEVVGPTGVTTRTDPFRLEGGRPRTVDVVLRPGARLSGRVLDAAGRPVERARVRFGHVEPDDLGRLDNSFRADDHLGPRTFVADAAGGFVCDDVPPGPTILRVDADGFAPWFRRDLVVPAEGDLVGVTATLEGSKSVSGRVLAADTGKPVGGAWVFAVARTAKDAPDGGRVDPLVTLETGPDGSFVLGGLPPGAVDVAVSLALGYKNAWQDPATARRDGVVAGATGVDFRLVPVVDPAPK